MGICGANDNKRKEDTQINEDNKDNKSIKELKKEINKIELKKVY